MIEKTEHRNLALEALKRARDWMLLDDTYGDAQKFQDDIELVDAAIAALSDTTGDNK